MTVKTRRRKLQKKPKVQSHLSIAVEEKDGVDYYIRNACTCDQGKNHFEKETN